MKLAILAAVFVAGYFAAEAVGQTVTLNGHRLTRVSANEWRTNYTQTGFLGSFRQTVSVTYTENRDYGTWFASGVDTGVNNTAFQASGTGRWGGRYRMVNPQYIRSENGRAVYLKWLNLTVTP